MNFDKNKLRWTREPKAFSVTEDKIEIVTNHGYSDWATTEIPASVKSMWYRLSRREDDFLPECSEDGATFKQMRVCHMFEGKGAVSFGVYACSPEASSFKATFTNMELSECRWLPHNGQQPDEE